MDDVVFFIIVLSFVKVVFNGPVLVVLAKNSLKDKECTWLKEDFIEE